MTGPQIRTVSSAHAGNPEAVLQFGKLERLSASPGAVKAIKAVLPKGQPVYAVGGVDPDNMGAWRAAGADGFGIGSALYRPGRTADEVGAAACAFVAAWFGSGQ